MHACRVEQNHHQTTREDVFLCIPPLYHTGAKMHWFGSLLVGGKAVLLRGTKPEYILNTVSREGCTIVWLLVPWAQDLLDALDRGELKLSDYRLSQWRLMHIGAQPVPPSLIKRWMEYFPWHKYDTNYGLSESIGPGCVHLGMENLHKVGAIGIPGYGWEAEVVDDQLRPVPQGTVGELAVRGPGVMTCYYRDPQATAQVLKDGWLLTGDMATQSTKMDSFSLSTGRRTLSSAAEKIFIRCRLKTSCASIRPSSDVAVIGLPDHRLGEHGRRYYRIETGRCLHGRGY